MARGKTVDVAAILGGQLEKVSESDTPVRMIPLKKIVKNNLNFYPALDENALTALMDSIRANGLLEPLIVVPVDDYYRLISGHNRFTAILRLQAETAAGWDKEVLCRVLPPMDEARELTAVIEANRQRVKTPALLAEEADKLTQAYMTRKRCGEDLPGRIRDRVAEAMQVSKTKLANLNAIRNGIKVPGIKAKWEHDEIPEASALIIARLPLEAQYRLLDWVIDGDHSYSIRDVRMFDRIWLMFKHDCPDTGKLCHNAERMYKAHYRDGNLYCCGCCRQCLKRDTCPESCCKPSEPEPGGTGIAPPPELENRVEWSADDWEHLCGRFSERLRACREQAGLDRTAFAEKVGEYKATYSSWENGRLPGSGRLPKLAVTLGVSIDYLYGLTDDPSPRPAPAQWQPLDEAHWPADQQLVVIAWDNPLGGSYYETARCVGGYYDTYPFVDTDAGCNLEEPSHGEYVSNYRWMPLPEKEET